MVYDGVLRKVEGGGQRESARARWCWEGAATAGRSLCVRKVLVWLVDMSK